jgi:hypothetical protein
MPVLEAVVDVLSPATAFAKSTSPGSSLPAVVSKLTLRCRHHFNQGYKLPPYRLIFDSSVSMQQPKAEIAAEKQQALDFRFLAVTAIEECQVDTKRGGDPLSPRGPNSIDASLIFLDLLKADPELLSQCRLRHPVLDTPCADSPPHFDVGVCGRSRMELRRLRFGLLPHCGRPRFSLVECSAKKRPQLRGQAGATPCCAGRQFDTTP